MIATLSIGERFGAYEFAFVYLGDLDGDCDVDFADFAIFANNWLFGK